jgi:predicted metal-binding membrane protein
VCWVVSVWQMTGMDMRVTTRLGLLGFFATVWAAMMAAMMRPSAALAVARAARASGVRAVPLFARSYLAVGALAGAVVFAADRPHGMAVIAVLDTAQKLLPPTAAVDVPLALAIVALGVLIIVNPSSVPWADAADVTPHQRWPGQAAVTTRQGETRQ